LGDPHFPRKKYSSPRNPWRSDQLTQELYLVGTFGLRNKRELWKAQTKLSQIRKQARSMLAAPSEERVESEQLLHTSLQTRGIIHQEATIEDVLKLTIEDILERRLQTVVWRKGLATSPHQARQRIAHGHILIANRVVTVPGYTVTTQEEQTARLRDNSPLLRQTATEAPSS
jgi:small subunit ribosomal protein S4